MTTPDLNTCAGCLGTEDDQIKVVACRHVIEGTEPANGEVFLHIHGYTADAPPPNHSCNEKDCPEVGLCGSCWTELPAFPAEHYFGDHGECQDYHECPAKTSEDPR